jgi:hypothetical protein
MDGICIEVMTDLATYFSDHWAASTLYAARGRLIPFNSKFADWLNRHGVLDLCDHPED